jgi:hypothetical protein
MIFLFQNQTNPPPRWGIFRSLQGVVEAMEWFAEHLASLGMLNLVQACPSVSPQLFGRIGVSASAASPFCVWSCHNSCARAARATFAGTERHHQIATALQTLSSCHDLLSLQREEFSGHNCTLSAVLQRIIGGHASRMGNPRDQKKQICSKLNTSEEEASVS